MMTPLNASAGGTAVILIEMSPWVMIGQGGSYNPQASYLQYEVQLTAIG
jgi:hypothetical protein